MVTVNERYGAGGVLIREKMCNMVACYKGDWIYLNSISPSGNVEYWPLSRGYIGGVGGDIINLGNTDVNDIKFTEYPLGFGRLDGIVYYVSRVPVRKNRFGLRADNISFTRLDGVRIDRDTNLFDRSLSDNVLENILKGVHPSFQAARDSIIRGDSLDRSFDRDFALVRATRYVANLYYKTDACGEISLRDQTGELYPSFDHLYERLVYSCRVPPEFIQKTA
jgi:hypothetical protein